MTNAISTLKVATEWEERLEVVKQMCSPKGGLTNAEFEAFVYQAKKTGLDPLARQIYVMSSGYGENKKISVAATIDGCRLVAKRSQKYQGQLGPYWCGKDGIWVDVWLQDVPPAAAKVGVMHADFKETLWAVARWTDYATMKDEYVNDKKTGRRVLNNMWQKMGPLMLSKCAEMLALRKAFPQELSGVYSKEEMEQGGFVAPEAPALASPPTPTVPALAAPRPATAPARKANPGGCSGCDGVGYTKMPNNPEVEFRCETCGGSGVEFAPGKPVTPPATTPTKPQEPTKPAAPPPTAETPAKSSKAVLAEFQEVLDMYLADMTATAENIVKAWETMKINCATNPDKGLVGKAFNAKQLALAAMKNRGNQ